MFNLVFTCRYHREVFDEVCLFQFRLNYTAPSSNSSNMFDENSLSVWVSDSVLYDVFLPSNYSAILGTLNCSECAFYS